MSKENKEDVRKFNIEILREIEEENKNISWGFVRGNL